MLDSASGVNINFRGVASANAMLVVTLDNVNHNVLLTLDATAIANNLPAATTAQAGVLETATDAEAIAKVATDKIVTPSNFAAMAASTTFAGLAEIATQAEVTAGVSATTIVAPDTLSVLLATKKYTTTWADNVARAALVPAFEGQFGYQLDTNDPYIGFALVAGAWLELLTTETNGVNIGWDFTVGNTFAIASSDTLGTVQFSTINVDWDNSILKIGAVTVPDNSVIVTQGGAGVLDSRLLNTFISTGNTQTGYTNFTNSGTLRTGDCNTLTLPEICQIVDTLIRDLKAVLLPAV